VVVVAGAIGAVVAVVRIRSHPPTSTRPCQATASGSAPVKLTADQAVNATTIAAVGRRLGLPDHAVTVALAAALQESGLHNLDHGDLDSIGLFQQRPSQGWGTPAQIMSPRFSSAAFYQRLAQLPDWQTMSVTEAAQAVQHSAAPNAYAQWEGESRLLARTVTGEVAAGFTCRIPTPSGALLDAPLSTALQAEVGTAALDAVVEPGRGWTIASWLVARAQLYRIRTITFQDRMWRPSSGSWELHSPTSLSVQINAG
jgi:hypothetical protein